MKGAKPKFNHQEAIDHYKKGMRVVDLAKLYKVSASAIRDMLQRRGAMAQKREDLT